MTDDQFIQMSTQLAQLSTQNDVLINRLEVIMILGFVVFVIYLYRMFRGR